jgi:uncharacterized membrane protein
VANAGGFFSILCLALAISRTVPLVDVSEKSSNLLLAGFAGTQTIVTMLGRLSLTHLVGPVQTTIPTIAIVFLIVMSVYCLITGKVTGNTRTKVYWLLGGLAIMAVSDNYLKTNGETAVVVPNPLVESVDVYHVILSAGFLVLSRVISLSKPDILTNIKNEVLSTKRNE